jgi:DNA-binding CsgD family transcriptional regulator
MFTHIYWYFDSGGRMVKSDTHRGKTKSYATFAYSDELRKNWGMRKLHDDPTGHSQTFCAATALFTLNNVKPMDDFYIAACKEKGMSDRVTEVALLLRRRKSNAEMADTLILNIETIRSHVKAVINKTGALNRTDAVDQLEKIAAQIVITKNHPSGESGV